MLDLNFYKDKIVLVTGHTGFKGTWLCKILAIAGAKVVGYSLNPPTNPNLFELSKIENQIDSIIGDIRDYTQLKRVFDSYEPEIVMHLAAQPIVRDSYKDPKYTYETNVLGTVNLLECVRNSKSVKSVLNITTDKVYLNNDVENYAFKEDDPLDGYDPYSNSKSCSELVTHSYKKSFFDNSSISVSTARSGNVIGGGDFAHDRIIPDCIRAIESGNNIVVRNPYSTRPYQHVLEPLYVYLEIAQMQYNNKIYESYYNVGPDDCDCINTGDLVTLFCNKYGDIKWISQYDGGPHEASFLKLSNEKIKKVFKWKPRWHIGKCVDEIVAFTRVYFEDKNKISEEMEREIKEFFKI